MHAIMRVYTYIYLSQFVGETTKCESSRELGFSVLIRAFNWNWLLSRSPEGLMRVPEVKVVG